MKNIIKIIILIIITILISINATIKNIQIENVENGNITIKIFNQYYDYEFMED